MLAIGGVWRLRGLSTPAPPLHAGIRGGDQRTALDLQLFSGDENFGTRYGV